MNYSYQNDLAAVYETVINDVIESCREMFADERVDETVLDDLKAAWRHKMMESGALPSAANRAPQHNAVYMPVAHKGQPNLIAGQVGASGSRTPVQQNQQMANLQPMVMGQQRISAGTHVLSQAAYMATSAIRSQQLKPSDIGGMQGGQTLIQQAPNSAARGTNVISAVIVPVPKSTTGTDMKNPSSLPRRVQQLDGRYDGQPSSSGASSGGGRGASSREPPEKRFARGGLTGPVSDESDLSDTEIAGLDDFAAVGDEAGIPPGSIAQDEEPLNSGDDVSEAEEDVFDCPDLLVCQYEKVNRAKAKWRFSFRDAILQCGASRREYLFSRITGEAEFS